MQGNGELPKRIDLRRVSDASREKILAILLREEAAKIVQISPDELRMARDYVNGDRGGKGWSTHYKAFAKAMTKLVDENATFKQGVSKRLSALTVAGQPSDAAVAMRGGKKKRRRGK